jgi:hypothetical protein
LSTALPVIVPVVACPSAGAALVITRVAAATQPRILDVMPNLLRKENKEESRALYPDIAHTIHSAG